MPSKGRSAFACDGRSARQWMSCVQVPRLTGIAAARRAKLAAMGDSAAADGAGAAHIAPSAASKAASSSEPGDSSGGDDSMPAGLEAVLAQQQAMMARLNQHDNSVE